MSGGIRSCWRWWPQSAVDLLDEVVALFDQAVSARESWAKTKTDDALTERAKTGEARQVLLQPMALRPDVPPASQPTRTGLLR